jgi:hypothetical protein
MAYDPILTVIGGSTLVSHLKPSLMVATINDLMSLKVRMGHLHLDAVREPVPTGNSSWPLSGTVRVFRQRSKLDDAIGSHACSLEALACVWSMTFLSGAHCLLLLPL